MDVSELNMEIIIITFSRRQRQRIYTRTWIDEGI